MYFFFVTLNSFPIQSVFIYFTDLSKTVSDPVTRRLFYLRFFLLNSVSHIHNYFIRQISGDVFETVKNDIIDAPTLDAVIKGESIKHYFGSLKEERIWRELLFFFRVYACERLMLIIFFYFPKLAIENFPFHSSIYNLL